MSAIDATGLSALEEAAELLHAHGRALILCGAREQPARLMRQAEFFRHVGRENLCANLSEALVRAEAVHRERLRQTMESLGEAKLAGWAD
jgi:SulP family sulfate permease